MTRLIDARALIKTWDSAKSAVDNIDAQPTVDAVEVVRCCDCGKRDTEDCPMYHEIDCFTADGAWWIEQSDKRSDNGFCDRGERKEYV